jgi:two-component system cell cycle sensor histidine kinase/response regulator CckA
LAAVYGIVRSSKGFITVDSAPGAGATFRAFLPASGKAPPLPVAPAGARRPEPRHATILVADDEDTVRKLTCMSLRRNGYDVLEARDGRNALDVLAASPSLPDLILLDLAMPAMGGDELAPILRRRYPGLKIVITSGYPEEDARRGGLAGADISFLQKPFTIVTLADKVAEALGGSPPRSRPPG